MFTWSDPCGCFHTIRFLAMAVHGMVPWTAVDIRFFGSSSHSTVTVQQISPPSARCTYGTPLGQSGSATAPDKPGWLNFFMPAFTLNSCLLCLCMAATAATQSHCWFYWYYMWKYSTAVIYFTSVWRIHSASLDIKKVKKKIVIIFYFLIQWGKCSHCVSFVH